MATKVKVKLKFFADRFESAVNYYMLKKPLTSRKFRLPGNDNFQYWLEMRKESPWNQCDGIWNAIEYGDHDLDMYISLELYAAILIASKQISII